MFDIGALELLMVALVALVVLGPERLPRLARAAGLWVGRARRALLSVKEEIDREMKADELREILRKQARARPLDAILEETLKPERGAAPARVAATPPAAATESPAGPPDGAAR